MSPARTGLVIGKFMPPHAGHVHLVDVARAQVERLVVILFSRPSEPIPGPLRRAWCAELFDGVDLRHVDRELPQEPHEDARFWDLWTAAVRGELPEGPDLVFTSEDYGDELARRLGARHVAVDRDRARVPVSATAVRERPTTVWAHVPACVRPHVVRRVVVTGPESTGKTTLAETLGRRFGAPWVPEYAREFLDRQYRVRGPDPLCLPEELRPIVEGQIAAEDAAARIARTGLIVCDTDPTVTAVYSAHYFGNVPDWLARVVRERRYDLHLLLDVDVPWVADPQRDRPHMRREMHGLFRQALVERGGPIVDVAGDWAAREATAAAAIEALLARERAA